MGHATAQDLLQQVKVSKCYQLASMVVHYAAFVCNRCSYNSVKLYVCDMQASKG